MEKNKSQKKWIIILSCLCFALLSGVGVLLHLLLYSPFSSVSKDEFYEETGENLQIPVIEINTSSPPTSDTV